MTTLDDATPAPVKEGDVLDGKYRVERVLGVGGMGIVVAARHMQLEQRVAIKLVLPTAMASGEATLRFAHEARAASRLRSEHVARVLDVSTLPNGAPYMVMEYLEGRDLFDVIEQRGPLPAEEATFYVLQACEAIAEAHALGIVHRDLKPRNLFVTTRVDGRPLVKVLDFGISKSSPRAGAPELSLTRTSAIMGSPSYMSPEQLRSSKLVDARTDLWSLGVILYESLTGRVPFEAETITQLCAKVLEDTPHPLEALRPDLPAGLSGVILACLEKDPARRMPSVAALARALERFGGAASVGLAERIASVAGEPAHAVAGGSSDASARRVAVTGGTSVAWGETQLAPAPRARAALPLVIGAAVVLLLALGGAVAFWRSGARGPAVPSADLDQVPPVRQVELSPSPSVVALPPPAVVPSPPSVTPSVSASASSAMPIATQREPLTRAGAAAHPTARPVPARPPPPRPHDDMPDERN